MTKLKAYDLPLRIFHWSFALLFIFSFTVAKVIDDESTVYGYHMLSGMMMVLLIILRIAWGFVGSKTSKFSSFKLKYWELIDYFKSFFQGATQRCLGHNPASSYTAIVMFLFTIALASTGAMMVFKINKHFFEEVHELFANGFLVLVIFHIVGVVLHQRKHNDGMLFSMFTGKKQSVEGESGIASNHSLIALILIAFIILTGTTLLNNYDVKTGQLTVLQKQFKLVQAKGEKHDDHEKDDD